MEHTHHHMEAETQEISDTFTNEVLGNDLRSGDHGLHDGTYYIIVDVDLRRYFTDNLCGLGMDMMKMYFHGGYHEVILFDFWRISTLGGLIGSMIGCFILGILYEGLKFLREFLIGRELRFVIKKADDQMIIKRCCRTTSYTNVSSNHVDISDEGADTASIHSTEQAITRSPERRTGGEQVKIIQTSILSRGHLLQTLLQFVQVATYISPKPEKR